LDTAVPRQWQAVDFQGEYFKQITAHLLLENLFPDRAASASVFCRSLSMQNPDSFLASPLRDHLSLSLRDDARWTLHRLSDRLSSIE